MNRKQTFRLTDYVIYKLSVIVERSTKLLAEKYKPLGLTNAQWRILAVLSVSPHSSSSFIAHSIQMDKSRVTRTINSLLKRKLLIRELNADDKRVNCLSLTEKGQNLFNNASVNATRFQSRFITSLTADEKRILDNIILKFDAVLNQLESEHDSEDIVQG